MCDVISRINSVRETLFMFLSDLYLMNIVWTVQGSARKFSFKIPNRTLMNLYNLPTNLDQICLPTSIRFAYQPRSDLPTNLDQICLPTSIRFAYQPRSDLPTNLDQICLPTSIRFAYQPRSDLPTTLDQICLPTSIR